MNQLKGATPAPKAEIIRHQQLRRQGMTAAPVSPEVILSTDSEISNLERRIRWMRKMAALNAVRVAA